MTHFIRLASAQLNCNLYINEANIVAFYPLEVPLRDDDNSVIELVNGQRLYVKAPVQTIATLVSRISIGDGV